MKRPARSLALCLVTLASSLSACAHTHSGEECAVPAKGEAQAAAPAPVVAETLPPAPAAAPVDPASLYGSWVEFWALSGRTDTERYTFLPDGRFGWNAAANVHASPAHRWGRYRVDGSTLLLAVQGEDARNDCDGSAACRSAHEPPVEQRIALTACPANDEARALDASYRCISFADQAFWLTQRPAEPQADYAALAR